MVEFVLKNRTPNRLVYEYYPEGDTEKIPGLISVWIRKRDVVLDVAAEDDFITFSTIEEISKLKNSLDDIYAELGMTPENDEWDFTVESYDLYYYAEKVIDRLRDDMLQGKLCQSDRLICSVA